MTVHIKMTTSTVEVPPAIYDANQPQLRLFAEVETKIAFLAALGPEAHNSRQVVADRAPTRPVKGLASATWTLGRGCACRIASRWICPFSIGQRISPRMCEGTSGGLLSGTKRLYGNRREKGPHFSRRCSETDWRSTGAILAEPRRTSRQSAYEDEARALRFFF